MAKQSKAKKSKAKTDARRLIREPQARKDLFEKSYEEVMEERRRKPVECLGMSFENDDARRRYFLEKLAKKLKEPEFRKMEGFPKGKDDDILALSDPPYYTACPNPFLAEYVRHHAKTYDPKHDKYRRESFASDVSEGKNDPIYNAHSYHTKVPPKAIMRYILHYTDPGDVVFDGFCGTGMTAVAAQECAHADKHFAKDDLATMRAKNGARACVVSDLSILPAFIAGTLTSTHDTDFLLSLFDQFLDDAESQFGKYFRTSTDKSSGSLDGYLNYCVWSDVFICPDCSDEFVYWDAAVDLKKGVQKEEFECPKCGSQLVKRTLERAFQRCLDPVAGEVYKRAKRQIVLINYELDGKRYSKSASPADLKVESSIAGLAPDNWVPVEKLPQLDRFFKDGLHLVNLTYYHRFYFTRTLHVLAYLWARISDVQAADVRNGLRFVLTSMLDRNLTIRNRFVINEHNPSGRINGPLANTLYVPGLSVEQNPIIALRYKAKEAFGGLRRVQTRSCVSTQSLSAGTLPDSSVDYVFVDPPFGHNIMYCELNALTEAWLKVHSNPADEAVVSEAQKKDVMRYLGLMTKCFETCYRVLKPGRWMTVEFHNSQNAIWNAIQEALARAGFVVADVRTLDKQKGTINQEFYTSGAVKQDLVISAYRPTPEMESESARIDESSVDGVWGFVRNHLARVPVFSVQGGVVQPIPERMSYLLFDRMIAYYVQRGVVVPISSPEFYRGLQARFAERDEMFFLPEQVLEYDKRKLRFGEAKQLELFISDEASAIAWLKRELSRKPHTFQEMQPRFMKESAVWSKHELPLELRDMLADNFLCFDGKGEVPSQIHAYLSTNFKELRQLKKDAPQLKAKAKDRWYVPDAKKAGDLEAVRERALLREFWEYLPPGYKPASGPTNQADLPGLTVSPKVPKGVRMNVIRMEAVRVGFKHCWQNRDYRTIVAVARRIPEDVLQEDAKLLMWYDQAVTRLGEE